MGPRTCGPKEAHLTLRRARGPWSLTALLLLLPASSSPAQEGGSWFPLEEGTVWSYKLHITRQGESEQVPYTVRVARREQVEGAPCAVLETRLGESLLETTWFCWDGKKLRNPRRQSKRAALELHETGSAAGRIVLDLEALPPPPAEGQPPAADPALPGWSWTSGDGLAQGKISFLRREKLQLPGLGEVECLVLLELATFKVGTRQARQERRWWLAAGIGLVQEESRIEVDGGEASETRAVLERKPERS